MIGGLILYCQRDTHLGDTAQLGRIFFLQVLLIALPVSIRGGGTDFSEMGQGGLGAALPQRAQQRQQEQQTEHRHPHGGKPVFGGSRRLLVL